ncbi:MAG: hypothetical protein ABEN55_18085 [Bradymonadaceae bacterium]
MDETRSRRDELRDRLAEVRNEFDQLVGLRDEAETIEPIDLDDLHERREEVDADLAEGLSAKRERDSELEDLREELEQIEKGILPYPDEVEGFQTVLERHDVPHHLLADVVEVDDEEWTPAIESFLGRYRFAVLVTNMKSWRRASKLAREHDYPYGVLAPNYRGTSKYDEQGLYPRITVDEDDYADLVARLVRHVEPTEPEEPLQPPSRRRRVLSGDGFLMSRIEARTTSVDDHYLGRRARERRRKRVESRIGSLEDQNRQWKERATNLRERRQQIDDQIEEEKTRLEWERRRDDLSEIKSRRVELEAEVDRLDERIEGLETENKDIYDELTQLSEEIGNRKTARDSMHDEIEQLNEGIEQLRGELADAEARLGELMGDDLPEMSDEERERVDDVESAETASVLIDQLQNQLADVPKEVRDPLIVENYERQRETVDQVEQRLEERRQAHAETKKAAEQARDQYHRTTRRVFRTYFGQLERAGERLEFSVDGGLELKEDENFRCEVRLSVGDKPPVHHDSEDLSGGEKAALSILMGMTAVSLNSEGAGFFLIDEPFHHSDIRKINELGRFLDRTEAQYLVSMPTTADLEECDEWLEGVWVCTKASGSWDDQQTPIAPKLKVSFAPEARAS